MCRRYLLALWSVTLFVASSCVAADWPRFRGANLDGAAPGPVLGRWPSNGLPVAWMLSKVKGYSSFAVVHGKVFTLITLATNVVQERDFCVCLDAATGATNWLAAIETKGRAYSTPTVQDGRVYVYTDDLVLFCLEADTGQALWKRDLPREFGSVPSSIGNSQSPWVEDGQVFVSCESVTNCILAFNASNGALLWRGHTNSATFGSPVGTTIHGIRQIVFPDSQGLVAVAPQSGKLLWRHTAGWAKSGPSPVFHDDIGFYAGGSSRGGVAFRVTLTNGTFTTKSIWTNAELFSMYSTAVVDGGYLYANGDSSVQCVEITTGQRMWITNLTGVTSVVKIGDALLLQDNRGRLIMARASPSRYDQLADMRWSSSFDSLNSPAVWEGRLLVRCDNAVACFDARIQPRLVLRAALLPHTNRIRLTVTTSDGSPLPSYRAAGITLHTRAAAYWGEAGGALVLTNGDLQCELPTSIARLLFRASESF